MSDRSNYKLAQIGQIASLPSTDIATPASPVADEARREYCINVTDAATAGTAVTETVQAHVKRAGLVIAVTGAAPIAVTANDTNYATITVSKRTGAGGAVVVASQTTKITGGSGNLTAFVPFAITLSATASALQLAASDVLTVAVTKTGTGVALTAATSTFNVTVDVEEN